MRSITLVSLVLLASTSAFTQSDRAYRHSAAERQRKRRLKPPLRENLRRVSSKGMP
jgi:hypothetical protein